MHTDVRRSVLLFALAMLPMAIVIGAIAYLFSGMYEREPEWDVGVVYTLVFEVTVVVPYAMTRARLGRRHPRSVSASGWKLPVVTALLVSVVACCAESVSDITAEFIGHGYDDVVIVAALILSSSSATFVVFHFRHRRARRHHAAGDPDALERSP